MKWMTGVEVPEELHQEVEANKRAQKSAAKEAKQTNKQLITLIRDENHFTLYLAVAAGAKLKPKGA